MVDTQPLPSPSETPAVNTPKIDEAQKRTESASVEALPKDDQTRIRAESTATALDYEKLLLKGFVDQNMSITKHISVTFRSLGSDAAEFIFRTLSKKYGDDWSIIFDEAARKYYLAVTMQTLNGAALADKNVDDFLAKGETDNADKCLEERLRFIGKLPWALTNLLYAHYLLFSKRVDDFIRGGDGPLKNS